MSSAPNLPRSSFLFLSIRRFRLAFLAFLLLPTMLLIVRVLVLSWRYSWVVAMLEEMFLVGFYFTVCWIYRPRKFNHFEELGRVLDRAAQLPPASVNVSPS